MKKIKENIFLLCISTLGLILVSYPIISRFVLYPTSILYKPHAIASVEIMCIGLLIIVVLNFYLTIKVIFGKDKEKKSS